MTKAADSSQELTLDPRMSKTIALQFALALFAISGVSATAHANNFQKSTSSGRAVLVRHYGSWDKDCRAKEVPQIEVTEAPSHGTVSTRANTSKITDVRLGGEQCLGHSVAGVAVLYTPQAGYRGVDNFGMTATFADGKTVNDTATINVR